MTARRKGRATSAQMHPVRHYLAEVSGWACGYCGTSITCPTCAPETTNPATLDHIQPRSKGGSNAIANLRLACLPCNGEKADHDGEGWRRTRKPDVTLSEP